MELSTPGLETDRPEQSKDPDLPPVPRRHRGVKVQSVIDLHSWNQAGWTGVLYASNGPAIPPSFALLFSDGVAAERIFERWRERFGTKDVKHELSLSVIRRLPNHPPSNYAVQITSRRSVGEEVDADMLYQVASRVHVLEPDDDRQLESFFAMRRAFGCFLLAPAVRDGARYKILTHLAILKRDISVVQASDVGEQDIEHVALEIVSRRHAG